MKQYNLFMCVVRTSVSWTASNTLVAWSITMVNLVKKSYGLAHGVMDSLSTSIWCCRYLCRRTMIQIFNSLLIPVLLYGCETLTLNADLQRRIDVFSNKCLDIIISNRWNDFVKSVIAP